MMKKHVFLFLYFILFSFLCEAQTVYVTDSGKKFHKKNCTVVKEGKKGIDLAEAKKQGYTACNVCKPEAGTAEEPKKKSK